MARFRKSTHARSEYTEGRHCFEHWYRDNTVYFITARCRDGRAMFESEDAKRVFWDRFNHWTSYYGFVAWVTSLLGNHYHTLGFLRVGDNLGPMMQRIHGSVAKLVNDLGPERLLPFWKRENQNDYYPHTRVNVDLEVGVARAMELRAFLSHVEYAQYARGRRQRN